MERVNPPYEMPKIPDPINDLFKTHGQEIDMIRDAVKDNKQHLESFGNALDSLVTIVDNLTERLERIEK